MSNLNFWIGFILGGTVVGFFTWVLTKPDLPKTEVPTEKIEENSDTEEEIKEKENEVENGLPTNS